MERAAALRGIGAAEVLVERADLATHLRGDRSWRVDAVLDIVGTGTVLDSLAATRRGGAVCLVGFLGGGEPLTVQPIFQIPSGRSLSVFGSALVIGTAEFPLDEVPLQAIVDRVSAGAYQAKPAAVFGFEQIVEAHCLLESGKAGGKIVVRI